MNRQNIIIDGITYIVDLYDAIEDLKEDKHYSKFVMLRNGNTENDIFTESDVFIVEKHIMESAIVDGNIDFSILNESIVFPVTGINGFEYSRNYTDFNNDFNKYNFKIGNMIEEIYEIHDNDLVEAEIPCDRIRIYSPTVKSDIDGIIDIEFFMNEIKFHILCRKTNSFEHSSNNEFKTDKYSYSEFIDAYIPNVKELLSKNKYYFKDIYNVSNYKKKSVFSLIKSEHINETEYILSNKLKFINDNFVENEICNIKINYDISSLKKYDDEDNSDSSSFNSDNNEEPQAVTPQVVAPSGNIIRIDVGNNKKPSLVETTKYLFSKKQKTKTNVFNDGEIKIIQTFELNTENKIQFKCTMIVSSLLIWRKYFIGFVENNEIMPLSSYIYKNDQNGNLYINSSEIPETITEDIIIEDNIYEIVLFEINNIYDENYIACSKAALISVDSSEIKMIDDQLYCSLHLLEMPFLIEQSDILEYNTDKLNNSFSIRSISPINNQNNLIKTPFNYKTYFEEENQMSSLLSNIQMKFILYPYDSINEQSGHYVGSKDMNLDIFSKDYHIVMENSFKFDDEEFSGHLMISSKFRYPSYYNSVNEAYLSMLNQSIYNYLQPIDETEFDEEDFPEKIKKCGFVIEIATDRKFKNIIYDDVKNIEIENYNDTVIDDLLYVISNKNLNVEWSSYPDILIVRVKYYDRYTYTIIEGNHLMISKEIFKYMLNDNISQRIDINTLKENDMYFIDKINCSIIKNEEQVSTANAQKNSTKILYKPIFYKVRDLEQIKLKSGLTQNIGVNLSALMSKVDTFKISIDGTEYAEIGRNDSYVIFKINTLEFTKTSGQYNLLNQDDEFISDGTWYLY